MDFGKCEFSWRQWETVRNIFLLIWFPLLQKACCAPLSGERELGEEKLTADAGELDGGGMEVRILLRMMSEAVLLGLDSCGVCSSNQMNKSEAEHLSSEERHSLTVYNHLENTLKSVNMFLNRCFL